MTSADDAARDQRRRDQLADIHERLTTAVADLAGSDAWQHMLHIAAHMPTYSLNNILLVAVQRPDATAVAGYRAWRAAGRRRQRPAALARRLRRRSATTSGLGRAHRLPA